MSDKIILSFSEYQSILKENRNENKELEICDLKVQEYNIPNAYKVERNGIEGFCFLHRSDDCYFVEKSDPDLSVLSEKGKKVYVTPNEQKEIWDAKAQVEATAKKEEYKNQELKRISSLVEEANTIIKEYLYPVSEVITPEELMKDNMFLTKLSVGSNLGRFKMLHEKIKENSLSSELDFKGELVDFNGINKIMSKTLAEFRNKNELSKLQDLYGVDLDISVKNMTLEINISDLKGNLMSTFVNHDAMRVFCPIINYTEDSDMEIEYIDVLNEESEDIKVKEFGKNLSSFEDSVFYPIYSALGDSGLCIGNPEFDVDEIIELSSNKPELEIKEVNISDKLQVLKVIDESLGQHKGQIQAMKEAMKGKVKKGRSNRP